MPLPFFTLQESIKQRAKAAPKAQSKTTRRLDCETCGLFKGVKSPKMDYHGQGRRGILVLGEGPGGEEDEQNDQWVGDAGKFLRKSFAAVGIDFEQDCWRLNAVNCWTGQGNPNPTAKQINCCRQVKVWPALQQLKPRFILLMGNTALESFFGLEHSDLNITRFRGRAIPDKRTGAWVLPLFHPSFPFSYNKDENLQVLWRKDLERVVKRLHWEPPIFADHANHIHILTEFEKVMDLLGWLGLGGSSFNAPEDNPPYLVFDYETSGLKPFAPGHKIHSIACSVFGEVWSFPFQYPGHWTDEQFDKIKSAWIHVLGSPTPKIAQNIKMEDMWSRVILETRVENWVWDTMNNAHIVDNTNKTTGLKTQVWLNWGEVGYDDEFSKYAGAVLAKDAKASRISTHDHNRVHEMPLDRLLLYGGYDAYFEDKLYQKQLRQIRPDMPLDEARQLFHDATTMLCDIQLQGVPVDEEYYDTEGQNILSTISDLTKQLERSREAKIFHQKEARPINLDSNPDLTKLFFTHLGKKPTKLTGKSAASVDIEALTKLRIPFADDLLRVRHLNKIVHTYFDQIRRESVGGKCYPSTNLNIPATYRSSMDSPNLQNPPKRQKDAKIKVRRGITASKGNKLMEVDFSAIEVCGLGWYSKDPVLLRYLHDPKTDMHRDQAQEIFDLPPKLWDTLDKGAAKEIRFYAKNQWVFPQFYGSWYKACATDLWKRCAELPIGDGKGTLVRQHMKMGFPRFEDKMREYEDVFWQKFRGVRKWQDGLSKEYQEKGYIETFLGFRYGTWMTRNKLYNYKIQGTAFHLLLWSMIQLHKMSIEQHWRSRNLWEVHDSMIWDVYPPEQQMVLDACHDVMLNQSRATYPWINTPLKVEFEITGVDGTFADLAEFDEKKDNYNPMSEDDEAA